MNRRDFIKLVATLPFTTYGGGVQAYLWNIQAIPRQQLLIISALRTIAFPFSRISRDIPDPTIECVPNLMSSDGTTPVTGRFNSATGKILIKANQSPRSLKLAVIFEVAHLVDYYMPMTDLMRRQISRVLHGDNSGVWWPPNPASFFDIDGEAWMWMFGGAYASKVPYESAWSPPITRAMMPRIRRILRVPRVRTPQ